MTMASVFFGTTLEDAFDATALDPNLDSDTIKFALVTNTYTPDPNAHSAFADVTNEVTGTGYTTGGATLGTQTWATSGGFVTYDSADPTWAASTISSIRGGVGYDSTVSNRLLWAVTFGADYSVTSGTLTVQVDTNGWFRFDIVP